MKTRLTLLVVGMFLVATSSALATVRYVNVNNANPAQPYTNWASAATNIQSAVDAAAAGDEIVVTNGVYAIGGRTVGIDRLTNRLAVTKSLLVRSVNGPQVTDILGYQVPGTTNGDSAIRCCYLTNGASLTGFTLTCGATRWLNDYPTIRELDGGGLFCESTSAVVSNCILASNSACENGGGAAYATLNNCILTGNSAEDGGGAA
jgi:hypothetical protein